MSSAYSEPIPSFHERLISTESSSSLSGQTSENSSEENAYNSDLEDEMDIQTE